ncbi:MAG: hypothetical protein Q8O30_11860, partial [Candidatus Omnitrophota bacterium]|nr:hypothetical protein [Candidatus Omnitrophota bacterium]
MRKFFLLLLLCLLFSNHHTPLSVYAQEKTGISNYEGGFLYPDLLRYEVIYPSKDKKPMVNAATNYNPDKVKSFYRIEFGYPYQHGEIFVEVYNNDNDAIQRLNENILVARRFGKNYILKTYYNKERSCSDTIASAGRQIIKRLLFTEKVNSQGFIHAEQRVHTFTFRENKAIITICYEGSFYDANYKKNDVLDFSFMEKFIQHINSHPN